MIAKHRGALEYDWRTRFGTPLAAVGKSVEWGEAIRLASILCTDPSSMITAALKGWDHPITRENLALLDLYDRFVEANTDRKKGRPKPHPGRPFKPEDAKARERRGTAVPVAQAAAILNRFGHSLPV